MAARKAVDRELSRKVIIDGAHQLFVDEGYQAVSMRMIARELGYSHGAIYYHFKNKAELFYAMVEQDFVMFNKELMSLMQHNGVEEENIKGLLRGFIRFGLTYPNHYEVMFMMKDKEIEQYATNAPEQTYKMFADAIVANMTKQIEVKRIWSAFLMLHGFVSHYVKIGHAFQDVEALTESYVDAIFDMLAK
ncbi:helix-turn-helix domain-containing protein [Gracilibacillus sp. S3-1-1]|uniref:Helix-turn-helix domain-containing protein n=1 Tax=Gracilibacillus pellucidus TaxID=3095368 RepID=A0ACC6M4G6_9BACI|nr:helix-turn-helix domain-containing protein [Gracilibacillus sp. S3-1-1]MDX8045861.1 helix-turn-helix domain-containing protein [Gracilibacillus sp. S3-1-1]